jgi:glutaredoxin
VWPRGDSLAPLRIGKQVAQGLNELLDQPLCSADELEKRRAAQRRLDALLRAPAAPAAAARAPAPVVVYFEKDRNARELGQIKEVLAARGISPKLQDVSGDEATIAFVMREAGCERDELPVVFAGASAIGGFRPLAAANANGVLMKAVFGE